MLSTITKVSASTSERKLEFETMTIQKKIIARSYGIEDPKTNSERIGLFLFSYQ